MTAKYRGFLSPRRDNIAFMFGIGQEMRDVASLRPRKSTQNRKSPGSFLGCTCTEYALTCAGSMHPCLGAYALFRRRTYGVRGTLRGLPIASLRAPFGVVYIKLKGSTLMASIPSSCLKIWSLSNEFLSIARCSLSRSASPRLTLSNRRIRRFQR
jgi:hypothetical protein